MRHFICLFFDADGIVRATDTVPADTLEAAVEKAQSLFAIMTPLRRFELWYEGQRVYRHDRA